MKKAIIHLTDLHIDNDFDPSHYSSTVAEAVFELSPDCATICISGDLANSGQSSQYNIVDLFFNNIKKALSSHNIRCDKIVFVPGNHDIEYNKEEVRSRSVLLNMSEKDYYSHYEDEIQKFNNYYSFSECYELPDSKKSGGRTLPFVVEKIDSLTIKYYLLNNSLYTTFHDLNKDDSKGTILIPKEIINSIDSEPNVINFLIMHYPLSYLDYDSFSYLKGRMKYLTYILTGHTHDKTEISFKANENSCAVSVGYALHNKNYPLLEKGFSILMLDIQNKTINNVSFIIDKNHPIKKDEQVTSFRIPSGCNPIIRTNDFSDYLNEQDSFDAPLEKTFVFPELSSKDEELSTKNIKITSFEELYTIARKGAPLFICGSSKSGKTSLLKMLHYDFDSIGISVLFESSEISDLDHFERTIKNELGRQYSDSFSWQVFNSLSKDQRIALIDNAVFDKDTQNRLNRICDYFGVIILTVNESRYDARKQLMSGLLTQSQQKRPVVLNIRPMFFNKRKELVLKCFNALSEQKHKKASDEMVDLFFANVQNVLDRFVGTDSNYPYFIEMASTSFFDKKIIGGASSKNLYNEIYRAHITTLVENAFKDDEKALLALKVLPLIASCVFKKNNYSVKDYEIIKIVDDFKTNRKIVNKEFGSIEIIDTLIKSKVLCRTDECVAFSSVDFLAYFAAQNLSDQIDKDYDKYHSEIDNYLNNCHLDINVRFLLFLAFFSKQKVYEYIVIKAKEYCLNHISSDVVDMEFAKRNRESKNIKPLSQRQKKSIEEKRHIKESKAFDKKEEEYRKEVDEGVRNDASDFEKDIMKGWGILKLISSLIPDFKMDLEPEEQDNCISLLYKLPEIVTTLDNQLLNDNFELIINHVLKHLSSPFFERS